MKILIISIIFLQSLCAFEYTLEVYSSTYENYDFYYEDEVSSPYVLLSVYSIDKKLKKEPFQGLINIFLSADEIKPNSGEEIFGKHFILHINTHYYVVCFEYTDDGVLLKDKFYIGKLKQLGENNAFAGTPFFKVSKDKRIFQCLKPFIRSYYLH